MTSLEFFSEFALGLLVVMSSFTVGIMIMRNPHSYEEVKKAEQESDVEGPWPKP